MSTATNPYATQSVQTASPARLVTMLYDRLLTALSRARRSREDGAGGYELVNSELQRAQDILSELRHSLDHQAGGEMAASLDALYGFCIDGVIRANLTKDLGGLDPVTRIITDIKDAWAEACDQPSVSVAAGGPE
jgi:flagellar protein FliS